MQYSSWLTFFLVAFGGLAPALAAPLEGKQGIGSVSVNRCAVVLTKFLSDEQMAIIPLLHLLMASKVDYFYSFNFTLDCMATIAKQIAKRNETEHGCGGGTLASISATIENLLNNVTINVLSQDGNGNKN
ncbi:hypothetical protein DEU56DRAFT_85258 [Suillus clintonianus]|uniref:uncharacterized protein n=1 Tax=Suillus clintonianus TaxID=1904413 RepID=UPI001B85F260|nr:uncharacterized protein DEU56DRAFT_85258 [Suillus clintonianus]KAG2148903.1 hypothetical protein DEU56DRAFT_85258 [Suillus clintonianus]